MEIIALTNDGVLISATENEVKEIINSVSGARPEKLKIGQKIPAIDYAASITKVKALDSSYDMRELVKKGEAVVEAITELKKVTSAAANIDLNSY